MTYGEMRALVFTPKVKTHKRGRYIPAPVTFPQWVWPAGFFLILCAYMGAQSAYSETFKTPLSSDFVVVQAEEIILPEAPQSTVTPQVKKPVMRQLKASPTPRVQGAASQGEELLDLISSSFPEDPDTAYAVARAESGLRCEAVNNNKGGSQDRGLYQINSIHISRIERMGFTWDDMFDCEKNIQVARAIQQEQGWSPWVAYWAGSYKSFMPTDEN